MCEISYMHYNKPIWKNLKQLKEIPFREFLNKSKKIGISEKVESETERKKGLNVEK